MFMYEEPYEGRLSRTVLWEAWGEIPLAYPMCAVRAYDKYANCKLHGSFWSPATVFQEEVANRCMLLISETSW